MADKRIDQLTAATSLTAVDLMVTEQSGVAKKVTGDILANSAWNMMQKDASPTKDSTAPVTSGAVYDALGGVFSPTKLATPGALVHIEDGAYNQPIQGMKLAINPVQSMNGYDHPWPAGGGKNKLQNRLGTKTLDGVTCTSASDGKITITGIGDGDVNPFFYLVGSDSKHPLLLKAGTYVLSQGITLPQDCFLRVQKSGRIVASVPNGQTSVSFTLSEDTYVACYLRIDKNVNFSSAKVVEPMICLSTETEPTTFAPYSNICPISGWTSAKITRMGSNLVSPFAGDYTSTAKGITVTFSPTNVSITGTSTGDNADSGNMPLNAPITLRAGHTYVFAISGTWSTPLLRLFLRDESNTNLWYGDSTTCTWTVTPTEDIVVHRIMLRVRTANSTIDVSGAFYCNLGSLGAYELYKGTTYEVSFVTAGTVYGGTLTYNGDGKWTLTVDKAMQVFDGTEAWYLNGSGGTYRTPRGVIPASAQNCVCNMLRMSNTQGAPSGYGYVGTTNILVYLDSATADNLDSWKAYLAENNMQIVYPLATPLTYTLTAPEVLTALGINNIWADCGEIEELAYRADIGLYLVEALNPIKEMLANREDTMKATRAYSAGDYIIVGDTFYRAATAIANGATLTPGTNVIKTTVGDQLKALS